MWGVFWRLLLLLRRLRQQRQRRDNIPERMLVGSQGRGRVRQVRQLEQLLRNATVDGYGRGWVRVDVLKYIYED